MRAVLLLVRAVLVVGGLVVGGLVVGMAVPAAAQSAQNQSAQNQSTQAEPRPTVLVGVAGLSWSDVSPDGTPALWELVAGSGVASNTVRSVRFVTCPTDGWLSISAGRRAGDWVARWCRPLPVPQVDGSGATVPNWSEYVEAQESLPYDARIGLLGGALAAGGSCATAVGPGGALALATAGGRVEGYLDAPSALGPDLLEQCPVAVVDLGALPAAEGSERSDRVAEVDAELADLRRRLPAADVYVAGIADYGPTRPPVTGVPSPDVAPGLRLAMWSGPAEATEPGPVWLSSGATRWTGLVQLLDLSPMLTAAAGVPTPDGFVGRVWRPDGTHPPDTAETVAELVGAARAAEVFRVQSGPFFLLLGLVELVVFGAAYAVLRSRRSPRLHSAVQLGVGFFALAAAALPVASFLANLVRWWRSDDPAFVLWPSLLLITVAIAAVASLGPWRRVVYGPSTVVALVTVVVLAADVLLGSVLQRSSLLGLSPLTAGRFYGFGNIAYAVFAAACLVLAGGLAQAVRDRGGSPRAAAVPVAVIGVLCVVVDGAPFAGADFGGVIASICGFAVLLLGVLQVALTWRKAVLIGGIAVAVVSLVAVLDWLRPAESRTHFGDFVQSVIDGSAGTTVLRKADAAIGTLRIRPYYGWLVPIVSAYILLALRDPVRMRAIGLPETLRAWPILVPLAHAGLVTGLVGFAVNDSGIIVPALLLTVGIPLVVAAAARAQRLPVAREDKLITVP